MQRTASAQWLGDLKTGKGNVTTASGTLKATPYSFTSRFESGSGTNPEELLAAAHAGCFTMALSAALTRGGTPPQEINTKANLTLEQVNSAWTITKIHLDCTAKVPGLATDKFAATAADAKANCPVSRLFKAEITLEAKLG